MIRFLNGLSLLVVCFFMQACYETYYGGNTAITNVKISGPFLLNNGERLQFKPECYYNGTDQLRCGLSFIGLEESKLTYSYCPGGDFGCDSKSVTFDNTDADLSGIEITQKKDKSYKLDSMALIEPDEYGIVDFTIKDKEKNEIHVQYNMSDFFKTVKDSIVISDNCLYLNMEYYLREIDTECNRNQQYQMNYHEPDQTVFISDTLIRSCFNYLSLPKMAVASFSSRGSIDYCEASSGVSDPYPIDPLLPITQTDRNYCEQIVIYPTRPMIYYVTEEP